MRIYPRPLGDAIHNQRRHLKRAWLLLFGVLIMLVGFSIYCLLTPVQSQLALLARLVAIVALGISAILNMQTINNTRKLLRQFHG